MTIRFAPTLYLLIIAVAALFWTRLDGLLYPADVFPRVVLVLVAGSAIVALIQEFIAPGPSVADRRFLFACAVAASAAAYIWLITFIGYYLASTLYLMVLYPLVNVAKDGSPLTMRLLTTAGLATLVVISALYVVFTVLLKINVPMLFSDGPI
jgi:hypothetical protein